jgi:hypothetical protein
MSLAKRYIQAAGTSESANLYFQNLVKGIDAADQIEWEHQILNAEKNRLLDRSLMDVLGAKEHQNEPAAAATSNHILARDSVAEWIQLGIEIEEKQYVYFIISRKHTNTTDIGLKCKTVFANLSQIPMRMIRRKWTGCDNC